MLQKGLNFYPKRTLSLWEHPVLHVLFLFPKQAESSAGAFYEILYCPRGCPSDSRLGDADHLWREALSVILLVPLWAPFWGQFGLSSHRWDIWVPLWDCFVLPFGMVLSLLKSNSFDINLSYIGNIYLVSLIDISFYLSTCLSPYK